MIRPNMCLTLMESAVALFTLVCYKFTRYFQREVIAIVIFRDNFRPLFPRFCFYLAI